MSSDRSFYDRYWADGRSVHSGSEQGYAPFLRAWMREHLAGRPPGQRILEVGCGDASFTRDLARHSEDVTALDLSGHQIALNARELPAVSFLQHDLAEPLPFPDASFDVAWCSEVLEHLFDPAGCAREIHRVLRPGGLLLATVPYHGLVKNVLIALFKWDEHFTPSNPHVRFFTIRTLSALVREAGFTEIGVRTCGIGRPLRDLIVRTNILLAATRPGSTAPPHPEAAGGRAEATPRRSTAGQ
jgi:2-polyprenyl-6-hydroxyphenyl methylase/3-demethylubiquinone-9 3-methyltransferase